MKRRIIVLALSYPLAGIGSILKMDLICSINGSMDVLLFEYTTCPNGDSQKINQPDIVFLARYFCIYKQDIRVEIPNSCLNHTDTDHRIHGLQSCNVFSLWLQMVNQKMSTHHRPNYSGGLPLLGWSLIHPKAMVIKSIQPFVGPPPSGPM